MERWQGQHPIERRARPWSVPVALADVPETGRHFDLAADEHVRAAIAKLAGLRALPRLAGRLRRDAARAAAGCASTGRVSATVGQTCVVTLEPVENEIEEEIDLVFAPAVAPTHGVEPGRRSRWRPTMRRNRWSTARVDLGAIAIEFLMLGIDPYPRKPGAVFEAPAAGDDTAHPFAALAALKKGQGRQS